MKWELNNLQLITGANPPSINHSVVGGNKIKRGQSMDEVTRKAKKKGKATSLEVWIYFVKVGLIDGVENANVRVVGLCTHVKLNQE